jgi:hypothetical protein
MKLPTTTTTKGRKLTFAHRPNLLSAADLPLKRYITLKQLQQVYSIGKNKALELLKDKKIQGTKIVTRDPLTGKMRAKGTYLISVESVENFLRSVM